MQCNATHSAIHLSSTFEQYIILPMSSVQRMQCENNFERERDGEQERPSIAHVAYSYSRAESSIVLSNRSGRRRVESATTLRLQTMKRLQCHENGTKKIKNYEKGRVIVEHQ